MKNTFLKSVILLFCFSLITISCNDEKQVAPKENKKTRLKKAVRLVTKNATSTPSTSDEDSDEIFINSVDCFDFKYPYTYTVGTLETIINSQEEEIAFFKSLSDTDNPELKFPITIVLSDDSEKVIKSEEELNSEYDNCFDGTECFTINYPVTFTDGTTEKVINSETEFFEYTSTLAEDVNANFVYPISVTNDNGDEVIVDNDEEFDALYSECFDFSECETEDFSCFEIDFPVTAVSATGGDIMISNNDDLDNYFDGLDFTETPNFKYPLIINYEDGTKFEIINLEELETAFDDCFYSGDKGDINICFDIKYPISIIKESDTSADITEVAIESDEAFYAFIDQLTEEEFFNFKYPLTVILNNGSEKAITSDDDFIELVDSCI